ncbi:DNA cytosine methyltransferase [Marinobacter oulmenensis]|uniref:DNA (cytosine-5-)-methyltransferase n=1 Tax=Marinobacter oulmenensis TaxID=643747 RepID=A0A840U891_9GAMM|nr:DNA (cytosine-5)-methyltransferase 1 [Marinobacter oulmenensis]
MKATVSNIRSREFKTQYGLSFEGEINGDLFAGGGGASTGVELGTGQPVHFAINHNEDAISQHQANHPGCRHYVSDVFEVDPHLVVAEFGGRLVGHLHASPDCTDHSQAAGGQPRKKAIRSLAWVVHKWAGRAKPRIITMENVEQMLNWAPLVAKRCPSTGRVVTLETIIHPKTGRKTYRVAEPGERVPVTNQYLVPCKKRKGQNWKHFVEGLRAMGYQVQWRTLRACDYGAGTTRERLFLIARRDGLPITWPKPTHAKHPKTGQKKWVTAADSIDWSIPVPSIFTRKRPLADNTLRRIAKGIRRFVLDNAEPFIVPIANYGAGESVQPINEPLRTITAWPRGGSFSLVTAYMAQMNGGYNETPGHDLRKPMTAITSTGSQQQLVTAFLSRQFGASIGSDVTTPAPTITAGGGGKSALVQCTLSPEQEAGALQVAAFLMHYYSTGGQWGDLNKPLGTITTKDRLALVTVTIKGQSYVIVDIGLRMLTPRELYNAQGFPPSYVIDHGHDGRKLTKTKQVLFVGNSVSPHPMAAICREAHRATAQAPRISEGATA